MYFYFDADWFQRDLIETLVALARQKRAASSAGNDAKA
jgi:hypothetical protein